MDLEKYSVWNSEDHKGYVFYSEGPNGTIKKSVEYRQLMDWDKNIYNLFFGDWDEKKQRVDDAVASNNGDRDKVLASVAQTVLMFTKKNPEIFVYAEGSNPSRTRLYQMTINKYLTDITRFFDIYGFRNNKWEPFKSARNYEAFLAKAKQKS